MEDRDIKNLFESSSKPHVLFHKIISSMWRWGMGRGKWNDIVASYQSIKNFDLGLDDFTVTLDYTTYFNPYGYSDHTRTYLDGVFGYLVHYKGEHVMTIGFSIMTDRNVLIQQVQLVNKKGNRFLFKFPKNRLEYIISRFEKTFTNHTLFVIDGEQIANKSLDSYTTALQFAKKSLNKDLEKLNDDHVCPEEKEHLKEHVEHQQEEVLKLSQAIEHLSREIVRLKAFYAETGRYRVVDKHRINSLTHYQLAA